MASGEHSHKWNYYGVEVTRGTNAPEDYSGQWFSNEYKVVEHYRVCPCGVIEINVNKHWLEQLEV